MATNDFCFFTNVERVMKSDMQVINYLWLQFYKGNLFSKKLNVMYSLKEKVIQNVSLKAQDEL